MDIGFGSGDTLTGSPEDSRAVCDDWKMWFPDEGDPRHGTPDDPRLVLIGVDIHAAVFHKPQPVVLLKWRKAG